MLTLFLCLLIQILIVFNGSSTPLTPLTSKEFLLKHETDDCNDPEMSLNFSSSSLMKIESNFLANSFISCLNMNNNNIKEVSPSAFNKLPNLIYLNLANNSLNNDQILRKGSHTNLKVMILDNTFSGMLTFKGTYPSLKKLYLRHGRISWIERADDPDSKRNFRQVTHLYLNDNEIFVISSGSDFSNTFTSLKYLNLNNNNLRNVYLELPKLRFFLIDNNSLFSLDLKNAKNLKKLSAAHNSLERLTKYSIGQCEKLKTLNLSDNKIRELNADILESCHSMEYLNLDDNLLSELPEINSISFLKILLMRRNKINFLNRETLYRMPFLIELRLDGNKILSIDMDTFSNLANLQILTLGNNNLSKLPNNWSRDLKNLRNLNLEMNQFKMLENLSLSNTGEILNVNLYGNPLQQLTDHSFDILPKNVIVNLHLNLPSGIASTGVQLTDN